MACFYGRNGKSRSSLNFLEAALSIEYEILKNAPTEKHFEDILVVENPSDSHLNICVTISQLNRHDQALQHALKALIFIQGELISRKETKLMAPSQQGKLKPIQDRYAVLVIAYHNLAVEQEFLKNVRLKSMSNHLINAKRLQLLQRNF